LVDKLRRHQARVRASPLDEGVVNPAAGAGDTPGMEHDERFAAVIERVNDLPELQRTVIMRAYLGGQTLRQIADELHTPIGTVKSALSRALLRLRERPSEEVPA
jgi:RNA polymerase sigma-70 factor (ECF subfamily)